MARNAWTQFFGLRRRGWRERRGAGQPTESKSGDAVQGAKFSQRIPPGKQIGARLAVPVASCAGRAAVSKNKTPLPASGKRRRVQLKKKAGYSVARMSSRVTPLAVATSRRMALRVPMRSGLWSGTDSR